MCPPRFGDLLQSATSHFPLIKDALATAAPSAQHSHLRADSHLHRTEGIVRVGRAAGGGEEGWPTARGPFRDDLRKQTLLLFQMLKIKTSWCLHSVVAAMRNNKRNLKEYINCM